MAHCELKENIQSNIAEASDAMEKRRTGEAWEGVHLVAGG
jgi:hypothetical protein